MFLLPTLLSHIFLGPSYTLGGKKSFDLIGIIVGGGDKEIFNAHIILN